MIEILGWVFGIEEEDGKGRQFGASSEYGLEVIKADQSIFHFDPDHEVYLLFLE